MVSVRSRFQGAMVGALVGDCLGSHWEMEPWVGTHPIHKVKKVIDDDVQQTLSGKAPAISYTDDTAMTLAMARSIVDSKGFNGVDMARKFAEEFFANPHRGYGAAVSIVFDKLKKSEYHDVFIPAREQFNGAGSYGNGAAMRVSPVSLFGYSDDILLVETARDSGRLTHAHTSGVYGAMLQAMAVKLALQQPTGSLKPVEFVDCLLEKFAPFEVTDETLSQQESQTSETSSYSDPTEVPLQYLNGLINYTTRLQQIRALLLLPEIPSADSVEQLLGHGVLANEAVPCALYAFLHCSSQSFRELVPYAISLGGDTDTIASMAGAIGGAYWGLDDIPEEWITSCEDSTTAKTLADSIYDIMVCL